jgi:pimeloyl-ACP methyl ester carboxylesterase
MKAFATTRVDCGEVKLCVTSGGNGPSVLFLHGFPEIGRSWQRVAHLLADSFTCFLPDLRGYDHSDKPALVEDYAIDRLIADVDGLIDHCGDDSVALAGHDWGGALAWWYAARRPERVRRLIIANAPHPALFQAALIEDEGQREASQYVRAFRQPDAATLLLEGGPQGLWERLFAANPAFSDDDRTAFVSSWSQTGAMNAMLNWYRAAPFIVPLPGEHATMPEWPNNEDLAIKVPTLVLWGMKDTALLPVLVDGLTKWVPDLRVERFGEAGHAIIHEIPDRVAQAIKEFLK